MDKVRVRDVRAAVYLPQDLREALVALAKREHRSVPKQIEHILTLYLEDEGEFEMVDVGRDQDD